MKIVVVGGTGLIGSKTVERLREKGHDVVAASPRSGVDAITGEGLAGALVGVQVVVDLANSPSFEAKAALAFFETSSRNLLVAGAAAGVKHHVALSVVGTERLQGSGYFRRKMAQENLIRNSGIPYTIIRWTQFFEFMGAIAKSAAVGEVIHLSPAYIQPISADDVADAATDVALADPVNGTIEIAGPERERLSELVGRFLKAAKDKRKVVVTCALLRCGARRPVAHHRPESTHRRNAVRPVAQPIRVPEPGSQEAGRPNPVTTGSTPPSPPFSESEITP